MTEKAKAPQPADDTFINPIDPDKITDTPHLLPYAHMVGGVKIDPIDRGRAKGIAVTAMYEQTDRQLEQIRRQVELLVQQARDIQTRVKVSEEIYLAEINFEPAIGKDYHLYRRAEGGSVLSLVSPEEWGKKAPYVFVASVRLLSDHTWDVLRRAENDYSE